MDEGLLEALSVITDEEKEILEGNENINRSIYYNSDNDLSVQNKIDASLLLAKGKIIDIRPHTRFIHFPAHTHNFVEVVYMCQGSTTHIIDGQKIILSEGDILFMNQHAVQEIMPAGKDDIAVNFIIMPQFFDSVLKTIDIGSMGLRDFIISCLTDNDAGGNYLYFNVAGILPIQNIMENLVWVMLHTSPNRRTLSISTMVLLFQNLVDYADKIHVSENSYEQNMMLQLMNYIDQEYKNAVLTEFSIRNSIDVYTMSRLIKRSTGKTFTDLLAEKRLNQACYLLKNTTINIADIACSVGYENTSYFHRLFRSNFKMSPREYRSLNRVSASYML